MLKLYSLQNKAGFYSAFILLLSSYHKKVIPNSIKLMVS